MKLGTVLALLSASLIGGVIQQVNCSAQGTVSIPLRAEGLTELTGDIIITCVGGIPTAAGVPLPTGDLTVLFNATVTNRLYANGWSDALLIIDEPPHTMPQFPGDVAPTVRNWRAPTRTGFARSQEQARVWAPTMGPPDGPTSFLEE